MTDGCSDADVVLLFARFGDVIEHVADKRTRQLNWLSSSSSRRADSTLHLPSMLRAIREQPPQLIFAPVLWKLAVVELCDQSLLGRL